MEYNSNNNNRGEEIPEKLKVLLPYCRYIRYMYFPLHTTHRRPIDRITRCNPIPTRRAKN